jgi:hypothetical protein
MPKAKDLTGQKFGRLRVIKKNDDDPRRHRGVFWLCECGCGNSKSVLTYSLTSGYTKSCGCITKENPPRLKDFSGQKFGRLTAIKPAERNHRGKTQWICRCDCGNQHITQTTNLTSGDTKSCGCYSKGKPNNEQGKESSTRLYSIWRGMIRRCNDKSWKHYHRYGGRGISYCKEWGDFQTFKEWALLNGYNKDLTLDRVENNLGYSPSNCRWATTRTQNINRRPKKHSSKYTGVCWDKGKGKFKAEVSVNNSSFGVQNHAFNSLKPHQARLQAPL